MNTALTKPHSLRVAYENWEDPHRFAALCALLQKYDCGIDSIALFTSATHAPLTLAELERRAHIQKERMVQLRRLGFKAGINILATIGHHEEDLENSLQGAYYYMTGENGRVCRGSYCMNDERYLQEYVRPAYKLLAQAEPDFIWVDDDIRYGHMPIGNGCFCDGCIRRFNRENGTQHTRESLTAALNAGDLPTRRAWLAHNSSAVCNLFRLIGSTVRTVNERICLGFMTGERYMEGYDFAAFAEALSDGGKHEIMWRPGGGAYSDYRFDEIVEKSEQIGRQNAFLPEYVTVVQSEIENFPYQLIKKTPVSTALEAAWNMTAGCTGAAFNILPSETGEPVENIAPHLCEIERQLPLYRLLQEKTAGKQPVGIGTAWRPDSQLAVPTGGFAGYYGGMYAAFARELFDFGLPQSYIPQNTVVTLAHDDCTAHWSSEEVEALLKGGVYMDAGALEALNARGFGALTGFAVQKEIPVDVRERYTVHPLNEGFTGGLRNCRQAFNPGDSFVFAPTAENAQILAQPVDYHDRVLAQCSQGLYENALGGKIAVGGYYPFTWISDHFKITQLKRLMVLLSGGRLPSYVDTVCRIRNHTFVDGNRCAVALLNPTNQPLENLRVAVRTEKESAVLYTADGAAQSLPCETDTAADGYRFVTVPRLPAYEMILIEV